MGLSVSVYSNVKIMGANTGEDYYFKAYVIDPSWE